MCIYGDIHSFILIENDKETFFVCLQIHLWLEQLAIFHKYILYIEPICELMQREFLWILNL